MRSVDWVKVGSLAEVNPRPGDLVILDIDDTLIRPVHDSMQKDRKDLRDWWKPILRDQFWPVMARAWCTDRRTLIEAFAPSLVAHWEKMGCCVAAMTSRNQSLPWGAPMNEALVRQLSELGFRFVPCVDPEVLFPNGLYCTDGGSKIELCLKAAHRSGLGPHQTLWIVDDCPEEGWHQVRLSSHDPQIRIAHFVRNHPQAVSAEGMELLELLYFIQKGRWSNRSFPNTVKGLSLGTAGACSRKAALHPLVYRSPHTVANRSPKVIRAI
jgi:hypothetical protein